MSVHFKTELPIPISVISPVSLHLFHDFSDLLELTPTLVMLIVGQVPQIVLLGPATA
jgi:hypothetical protein